MYIIVNHHNINFTIIINMTIIISITIIIIITIITITITTIYYYQPSLVKRTRISKTRFYQQNLALKPQPWGLASPQPLSLAPLAPVPGPPLR